MANIHISAWIHKKNHSYLLRMPHCKGNSVNNAWGKLHPSISGKNPNSFHSRSTRWMKNNTQSECEEEEVGSLCGWKEQNYRPEISGEANPNTMDGKTFYPHPA